MSGTFCYITSFTKSQNLAPKRIKPGGMQRTIKHSNISAVLHSRNEVSNTS